MPTTVTKTIGTSSRDYSTLQAWEDAAPASLVTDDKIWRGEAYNDSEFVVAGRVLYVSGITTDSTRYVELTAAAGQSFQDNVNVRTNALGYNTNNGVALRCSVDYAYVVEAGVSYCTIRRLQVKQGGPNGYASAYYIRKIYDCLFVGGYVYLRNNGIIVNTVINDQLSLGGDGATVIGCSLVQKSSSKSNIEKGGYLLSLLLKNTACFGGSAVFSGTSNPTTTGSGFNATDQSSGLVGSNNKHSVSYSQTTPFTDNRASSLDLRAVSGTDLVGNATYDSTNSPNDISGTARSATAPTIGAWEYVSASLAASPRPIAQAVKRSYFF